MWSRNDRIGMSEAIERQLEVYFLSKELVHFQVIFFLSNKKNMFMGFRQLFQISHILDTKTYQTHPVLGNKYQAPETIFV